MAKVEKKRCVGQYEIRETLGKGGYSWVKKGVDTKSGSTVALKFMSRADKSWEREQAEQVRTEIKSMIRINSKNVMKLFAYNLNCKYPEKNGNTLNTILLVLEFCPGGELFDILYYTQQLDDKTARTYFVQMIQGLQECHNAGIIHRDIKPQNLLMDGRFQLKITDFGLSKLCKDANTVVMKTSYVGTRGYQAPELLKKKKYSKACDIFSAGVVLFILLTGYPPFEQAVKTDKWYNPLAVNDPGKFWKQHKGCGVKDDAMEVITRMLAYHPSNRIELDDILKTKFAKGPTHTPDELYKVLKKKHRETSKRRKKDKKKMSEMQHSVKKRGFAEEAVKLSNGIVCPKEDYEVRQSLMTKRWLVRPKNDEMFISKGNQIKGKEVTVEKKEEGKENVEGNPVPVDVVHAYIIALQALQCKGMTEISIKEKNNPWDLVFLASDTDKNEYHIHMTINQDDKGTYYFNFKRVGGADALKFHKFWETCETYFIHSDLFEDEVDEEWSEDEEEVENVNAQESGKADEAVQVTSEKVNAQREEEKRVDDEGKQEE